MLKFSFPKSDFTKNTFILIAGTAAAQSIPVLLQPFLRRIYSPEDFGAMAVYLTFFSLITIVYSLRYEATIVLPKNDRVAANLVSLTFVINAGFSLVLFLALCFLKNGIVGLVNFPERYANYLFLLPVAGLAFSMYQSINYWLIRQKAFRASAGNKVVRRGIEGIIQAALGFFKIPGGLFLGDAAGNCANALAGIRQLARNGYRTKFISVKKMTYGFRRYIDFPKYNALPVLLSNAATVLPFIFINKMYSTATVGYLDLSRLVLSLPLVFISSTISQVFFQQTTEKKHASHSIKKDISHILLILLIIILTEMGVILLFGPVLFGFIFGEAYAESGSFSQLLIFSFSLNFIGSTFSSVFITFEKIRLNSIWQVTYFIAICSLLLFKGLGIYDFLKLYVLLEVIMHLSYCAMIYFIVRNYEKKITS